MAGHEIRLADQIGRADGAGAETKVRHRARARLFGVVHKIPLRIQGGVFADNFDAVFVGAHRAVGAQAEKEGLGNACFIERKIGVVVEVGVAHVVDNANGKIVFRLGPVELVEYGLDHAGGKLFGGKSVPPANHFGHSRAFPLAKSLGQGAHHVGVKRLTAGAGFFGAVEHGHGIGRRRQGGKEGFLGPGPVQVHLQHAYFFAAAHQGLGRFGGCFGARTHDDEHALGVGSAVVVENAVLAAGQFAKTVEGFLHNTRRGGVVGVHGFAALEVHVGVLGSAAHHRRVGVEAAPAVGVQELVVDHGANLLVGEQGNFAHFMRGAEAVEKVDKRDAGFQSGSLANQCHVVRFLHGSRSQ